MLRRKFRETIISDGLDSVLDGEQASTFPLLDTGWVTTSNSIGALMGATTAPPIRIPNDCLPGDVLLAVFRSNANSPTATWPSTAPDDWSELLDSAADSSDDSVGVAWHRVTNRETTGLVTPTLSGSARIAAVCFRIRNAGDPQLGGFVAASTTAANPANFTPSGGAKNYLWIAFMTTADQMVNPPEAPTNYSTNFTIYKSNTGGGAANMTLVWGMRELNAASEDVGAFGSHTNIQSMVFVVAVPPA